MFFFYKNLLKPSRFKISLNLNFGYYFRYFLDKKVILRKMAGGNLDFLKGMALESAQLAVNYVKGEGSDAANSSHTSNVTAVSDSNCVPN